MEPLPKNWDGAGSSVHRGGARMWGDVSFAGSASAHGGASRKGGSHSGHGWPGLAAPSGAEPKLFDVEAAAGVRE